VRYALLLFERSPRDAQGDAPAREVPDGVALVQLPDVDEALAAAAAMPAAAKGAVEVRPLVEG
jgi:hypothetical protein